MIIGISIAVLAIWIIYAIAKSQQDKKQEESIKADLEIHTSYNQQFVAFKNDNFFVSNYKNGKEPLDIKKMCFLLLIMDCKFRLL